MMILYAVVKDLSKKKLTKQQQQQRIRTRAITNPTEFSAISDRIFTSSPRRTSFIPTFPLRYHIPLQKKKYFIVQ